MNPSFFLPLPPFRRSHAHIFVCLSLTHHPHYLRTWEQARSKNTHIFVIWLLLYPCSSPYCGCQGLFMSHFQSPNSLPLGWTLMANGPTVGTHSLTNAQGNRHYCYYWKVNATFIQQIMRPVSPQVSQAHVMSVLCKLTFSQESQCRITSNRWEIKYWGLRTLNTIILTYFSIK